MGKALSCSTAAQVEAAGANAPSEAWNAAAQHIQNNSGAARHFPLNDTTMSADLSPRPADPTLVSQKLSANPELHETRYQGWGKSVRCGMGRDASAAVPLLPETDGWGISTEVLSVGARRLTLAGSGWELTGLGCEGGGWRWRISSRALLEVHGWGIGKPGWMGTVRLDEKPAVRDNVDIAGVGPCSRMAVTGVVEGNGAPPLRVRIEFALPEDASALLLRTEIVNAGADVELDTITLLDAVVTMDDSTPVQHTHIEPDALTVLAWSLGVLLCVLPLTLRLRLSWAASLLLIFSAPYCTARYFARVSALLARPAARWTWQKVLVSGYQAPRPTPLCPAPPRSAPPTQPDPCAS